MKSLYPHQLELVEKSRRTGTKAVLLQAPTGLGKSVIATHIVHSAMGKGGSSWFIVPRRELLRQMSQQYMDAGIEHTFIAQGQKHYPQVKNVICSLGTLVRRLDQLDPPRLAIIDETHFGSAMLDTVVKWLRARGVFILGLSATPWKSSGQGLGCWYDAMVEGPSIKWLIENNYLSKYRAFAPEVTDNSMLKKRSGEFTAESKDEWAKANRKIIGNAVESYKKFAYGMRGITFTVSRAESVKVADAYNEAGIPAAVIDGTTPEDERARLAKALATGEILQLVSCKLLIFGYDLSAASGMNVVIQCMTDLCPSGSLADLMQKWGRFMRFESPTAPPHILMDHVGNIGGEYGYPDDERDWSLKDRDRKETSDRAEQEVKARTCPKCWYTSRPTQVCPNCGHVYPVQSREVEEVDGELSEVQRGIERKVKRMEVGRAKTLAEIRAIAKERGYSSGWIWHQARLKGISI